MLFILMGPSSTGKSSLASELNKHIEGKIYTGKDYLRLAKDKNNAWDIFKIELFEASKADSLSHVIYVTTEKEDIAKLRDITDAKFIKILAELGTLRERFAARMNGNLPQPVAAMLERQLKEWNEIQADLCINTSLNADLQANTEAILKLLVS